MTTNRFEIVPVNEYNQDEIFPLIDKDNSIPNPPSLPSSLTLINEKNKSSPRLFNSVFKHKKTCVSSAEFSRKHETLPIIYSKSATNLHVNKENDEPDDSVQSTIQSNTLDTNSFGLTNKFLHELRTKRRELRAKSRNLSIDQRIALNRYQYNENILRAQDIFDVHFELDDDNDNIKYNVFTEDAQEKIRKNIFHELDRQRMKQYHKQYRQLVLGRALLMFITSLLLFMSITLVYVVIELYDRANSLDIKIPDIEFIPMILNSSDYN